MYKVFINDHPIYLTNKQVGQKNVKCLNLKEVDLEKLVKKVVNQKWLQVYLYDPNGEQIIQKLKKKIPVVVAAGGLVKNNKGETLFIKRNSKWDLPKGRVEDGEQIEQAALRETEEETGVTGLELVKPLKITYHFFNRNNKLKLKETYWFEMKTASTEKLVPEKAEGIQKAVWKNDKKTKKALKKSYANIKELFLEDPF